MKTVGNRAKKVRAGNPSYCDITLWFSSETGSRVLVLCNTKKDEGVKQLESVEKQIKNNDSNYLLCKKKQTTAAISTSKVEDQAMSAAVHEAL